MPGTRRGSSALTGAEPQVAGSVNFPASAALAAVCGLTRYTWASWVPLRPSKLRLKVRAHTPLETGEPPMPMQGPQAHSRMRAPASSSTSSSPSAVSSFNTCLEPGAMSRSQAGSMRLPRKISAVALRSV
jgi:hypothetical protein